MKTALAEKALEIACKHYNDALELKEIIEMFCLDAESQLPAAQPAEPPPVAWAIFNADGNIRLWSTKQDGAQAKADELGLPLVPLFAGQAF